MASLANETPKMTFTTTCTSSAISPTAAAWRAISSSSSSLPRTVPSDSELFVDLLPLLRSLPSSEESQAVDFADERSCLSQPTAQVLVVGVWQLLDISLD